MRSDLLIKCIFYLHRLGIVPFSVFCPCCAYFMLLMVTWDLLFLHVFRMAINLCYARFDWSITVLTNQKFRIISCRLHFLQVDCHGKLTCVSLTLSIINKLTKWSEGCWCMSSRRSNWENDQNLIYVVQAKGERQDILTLALGPKLGIRIRTFFFWGGGGGGGGGCWGMTASLWKLRVLF